MISLVRTASREDVTPILRALIAGCDTLLYTQLITFEEEEFHSATAETVNDVKQLVEAGFEYVCDVGGVRMLRKRK